MNINEVTQIANNKIRKYDWYTQQVGDTVRLSVTDGEKVASVDITTGEDINAEIERLIEAVDSHEYGHLEG